MPNHRRRHQLDGPDKLQSQGRLQQQMVPVQDSYMQNRAEALQNVESTIVELSNIFSQLATMVAQQGEIAIRCVIIICWSVLTSSHTYLSIYFKFFLSIYFIARLDEIMCLIINYT